MSKVMGTRVRRLAARQMNVSREAGYVVARAAQGDARVISLGPLLFFSTQTGDAWVLDPADGLARCLAKAGEPLPAGIVETPDSVTVDWNATYVLEGDVFAVVDRFGRGTDIVGYPASEIRRVSRLMKGG